MATVILSQGILNHDSSPGGIPWETQEVLRIEALLDTEVLAELQRILDGHDYSWHRISQLLQEQLDGGILEFTLDDGSVIFEWNNLCSEKQRWESKGRLSARCAEFYKDCLINLKILPFQGGLSIEGPRLVTTKMEPPNLFAKDLSVFHKNWENLCIEDFSESNNEGSSWSDSTEPEHGNYVRCNSLEGISAEGSEEEGSEEDSDVSYKATNIESEDSELESEES